MATTEELLRRAKENANASSIRRNQYNPSDYTDSGYYSSYESDFAPNYKSRYSANPDLDTSEGLYRVAHQTGYKKQADEIIAKNSGENKDVIFSGGFISDVFDVLNVTSYGTVGLLKGKSFSEGVKERESFSDDDALGKFGLTGVIAGLALDIATDPITYVAPWTILKKVPGVIETGSKIADFTVGKKITEVGETAAGISEPITRREGGILDGRARELFQKVSYMFGADPQFKSAHERMIAMIGKETEDSMDITRPLANLEPKTAEQLFELRYDEVLDRNVFQRRTLDTLQRELGAEDFEKVAPVWQRIDALGKEMTDLGLLGKEKYEENLGTYIKNVYKEYELAKNKGFWGSKKVGVKGGKRRKEGLTEDVAEELERIENPAYLAGATMTHMIHDIYNARFMNRIAEFASDTKMSGWTQVEDTRRFSQTAGRQAELRKGVKEINENLKPWLKELKHTFKADKKVLRDIEKFEKEMGKMSKKRSDELFKFFNEGATVQKTTTKGRRLGTIPERLQPMANELKKFDSFEEAIVTRSGVRLQKLHENGVLQTNGFPGGEKALREFFNRVKHPYKAAETKTGEQVLKGNLPKIIQLQKQWEQLADKVQTLKHIDKKSINNSFINIERNVNEMRLDKDDLLQEIQMNKAGDLAGKYIPEEWKQYIDEVVNPSTPMGSQVMTQFKYMKVVMSPATHIRNIMSNQILNWWKLGIGPWRQDLYARGLRELRHGGKYWDEWRSMGGGADTYAAQELKGILDSDYMEFAHTGAWKGIRKAEKMMGDIYQGEESWAKMTAFMHHRDKGFSIEEAFKASQSATFNYAQVTPFIRKVRTSLFGVPFITFPLKAAPVAVETLGKAPQRIAVFGKIKNDLYNAAGIPEEEIQRELENEPGWVREGFFMRLPFQDEQGRSAYFDMSYIIPFGDLLTMQFMQPRTQPDTGVEEAFPLTLLQNNPTLQVLGEMFSNETFTGHQIWRESDPQEQKILDFTRHLLKTFAPPPLSSNITSGYNPTTGEKMDSGLRKSLEVDGTTRRNVQQELASYLGMKIQPLDADINEQYKEWNKKKGLQTLLRENGVISGFETNYIPE